MVERFYMERNERWGMLNQSLVFWRAEARPLADNEMVALGISEMGNCSGWHNSDQNMLWRGCRIPSGSCLSKCCYFILFFFSLTKSSSSTQMNGLVHPLVTQEQYQKNELFWGSNEHIITMNKVSGGDGIPVELFQILKDDAVKVLHSICQQIWKTHQWSQDWKRSVFIPVPKKGNTK